MPNITKSGTLMDARTVIGRNQLDLTKAPSLVILFIKIIGGTATINVELGDTDDSPIAVKTVSKDAVVKIAVPSAILFCNVTAINGASVTIQYRLFEFDSVPDTALEAFVGGEEEPKEVRQIFDFAPLRKLAQVQLGTSASAAYTTPATGKARIVYMVVANPTTTDATVKLWHDGTTDPFVILPASTIVAGGFAEFCGTLYLESNDVINAQASVATTLTLTIYGEEYT